MTASITLAASVLDGREIQSAGGSENGDLGRLCIVIVFGFLSRICARTLGGIRRLSGWCVDITLGVTDRMSLADGWMCLVVNPSRYVQFGCY